MSKLIGYVRKSTQDKNQRYSLESQINAIQSFAENNEMEIVAIYQDIESGTNPDRKGLKQALEHCEKSKCGLVVLRVDRLSRKPSQMFGLMENPNLEIYIAELGLKADPFMLGQMILFSFTEIELLSRRTKEGMKTALAKKRLENPDYRFGNPNIHLAQKKAVEVVKQQADEHARSYGTLITSLYEKLGSYNKVAKELNKLEIKTSRGKKWTHKSVIRLVTRLKEIEK